jgi:hypothetical protein
MATVSDHAILKNPCDFYLIHVLFPEFIFMAKSGIEIAPNFAMIHSMPIRLTQVAGWCFGV